RNCNAGPSVLAMNMTCCGRRGGLLGRLLRCPANIAKLVPLIDGRAAIRASMPRPNGGGRKFGNRFWAGHRWVVAALFLVTLLIDRLQHFFHGFEFLLPFE